VVALDQHLEATISVRRLQEDPATREIPGVILTADATPGQADLLRAAGARA
jgi:CheY-like chemotaxis protein